MRFADKEKLWGWAVVIGFATACLFAARTLVLIEQARSAERHAIMGQLAKTLAGQQRIEQRLDALATMSQALLHEKMDRSER